MDINDDIDRLNSIFRTHNVDISIPKVFGARDAESVSKMYRSGMGYGLYDLIISASNGHIVQAKEEHNVNQKVHLLLESIRKKLDRFPKYVPAPAFQKKK